VNDIRGEIAEGEAMDLEHGSLFYESDAVVRSVSVEEMASVADVVVLAAGRGGTAVESRLDLLKDNVAMARDIGRRLKGFGGIVIVVSNPVDVLTQVVADASGLGPSRVLGTGTLLDTARLRYELAEEFALHPRSIHAYIVGEHGDSEVCLWSSANVAGRSLRSWPGWSEAREDTIAERVRRAAYEIIRRKGATNHAIGLVTAALLSAILGDEKRVLTVSTVQQGAVDIHGVALSLPSVIGRGGVRTVLQPPADERELERLGQSAEVIRAAFAEVA
jgi:L-lactate dehydrogenase